METTMWSLRTDRAGFLEVIGGRPIPTSPQQAIEGARLHEPLASQGVELVWDNDPTEVGSIPCLVVVPTDEVRDFVAWASTYVGSYQPLTAFFRVLGNEDFRRIGRLQQPRLARVEAMCAGAVIGEALTHGQGVVNVASLTIPSCASTFSYAKARALAVGFAADNIEAIDKKWEVARELTRQPTRVPGVREFAPIWQLIQCRFRGERYHEPSGPFSESLTAALGELSDSTELRPGTLERMVPGAVDARVIRSEMGGTREQRVLAFERFVRSLRDIPSSARGHQDFICGYLASLLSPGSLEYAELLVAYLREFPMALVWYGVLAGLSAESDLLNQFGGLGRRVLRDILARESLADSPRADIALSELQILVEAGRAFDKYRLRGQANLTVEIAPLVTTVVRQTGHASNEQLQLLPDVENERDRLLDELDSSLSALVNVYQRWASSRRRTGEHQSKSGKRGNSRRK